MFYGPKGSLYSPLFLLITNFSFFCEDFNHNKIQIQGTSIFCHRFLKIVVCFYYLTERYPKAVAELPMWQAGTAAPPTARVALLKFCLPAFRRGGEQWSGDAVLHLNFYSSSATSQKGHLNSSYTFSNKKKKCHEECQNVPTGRILLDRCGQV